MISNQISDNQIPADFPQNLFPYSFSVYSSICHIFPSAYRDQYVTERYRLFEIIVYHFTVDVITITQPKIWYDYLNCIVNNET